MDDEWKAVNLEFDGAAAIARLADACQAALGQFDTQTGETT